MIAAKEPQLSLSAVALCCRDAAKKVRRLSNLVCGQISRRSATLLWRDPRATNMQTDAPWERPPLSLCKHSHPVRESATK